VSLTSSKWGAATGLYEGINECSGFIEGREFIDSWMTAIFSIKSLFYGFNSHLFLFFPA
jgi:hypothetical protein